MFLLIFPASFPAAAQTIINGDAWIQGRLGVGTSDPAARVEARASSTTENGLQVSGVDGTPFLVVSRGGQVGLSTRPAADLDINGSSEFSDIGLRLNNGNLYPETGKIQIAFGHDNSTDYRHAIRSVHADSTAVNGLDFLLWSPTDSISSVGSLDLLSLVTTTTSASVHVHPAGAPEADLVVSNGAVPGGGTVHRAAEVTPSSRELKSGISYLTPEAELKSLEELERLRHARYRYKVLRKGKLVRDRRQPFRRGIIFEEAPPEILRPGGSISLNERINGLELAFKELIRQVEEAQAKADSMRSGQ
jgi:hypothetical protein